ncbi:LytTR family DNA-binding domain-containing protein [Pseudozobellia sp. WGM2]|uniref:LytR/AlgR family response regulator transcription factor n=1 Tax=Pseudozobellia sp. WGM2 TaxID=2787625 RepID=UPI001ADF16EC|nr:LytTR family DNA-binding domain-containing protein [Pseudozobellia sp. WGM2]
MNTEKVRTAIIDASDSHRRNLANLVENNSNLLLTACYRNAIQAKKEKVELKSSLIFLDVEMPLITGFDLLESFEERPEVVLLSDKPDYALKAFEYNVTDYLLKPLEMKRFEIAVQKSLNNIKLQLDSKAHDHFFVKSNFRKVKINYCDIKWIEALGDYIKLVTKKSNHVVLSSMKAFEKQLPTEQFVRIHKSYIINLNRVEKLNHSIVEVDGKSMPISRNRKTNLMDALGL